MGLRFGGWPDYYGARIAKKLTAPTALDFCFVRTGMRRELNIISEPATSCVFWLQSQFMLSELRQA
jgi:hypothetical protein